jgi:hypothetical protein
MSEKVFGVEAHVQLRCSEATGSVSHMGKPLRAGVPLRHPMHSYSLSLVIIYNSISILFIAYIQYVHICKGRSKLYIYSIYNCCKGSHTNSLPYSSAREWPPHCSSRFPWPFFSSCPQFLSGASGSSFNGFCRWVVGILLSRNTARVFNNCYIFF